MASLSPNDRMRASEEKTRNWLATVDAQNYDDLESVIESLAESSIVESSIAESSDTESGEEQQLGTCKMNNAETVATSNFSEDDDYNDIKQMTNYNEMSKWDCVQSQFLSQLPQTSFSNISISNATNVVMGNIIKIKGDLIVNVKQESNTDDGNGNDKDFKEKTNKQRTQNEFKKSMDDENEHKRENKSAPKYRPPCLIIPRARWLAMDALDEYSFIQEPVDLVIICHTATSSSTIQSENVGIIRDIQTFHIETRGWDDIGYNFLIGCDGNVYEGRGWGVEGAHTFSYNSRSMGIAFVGCFIRKLPTPRALQACQKLLQRGKDEGHLSSNFKLMGHRQCISTESPGSKLFQEISTWEHFHDTKEEELNESDCE